jgi:hypothetical protein
MADDDSTGFLWEDYDTTARLRLCYRCGQRKPDEEFYDLSRHCCKECKRDRQSKRRAENPEHEQILRQRRAAYQFFGRIKRLHGLSRDDWFALFEAQNKACAICKNPGPAVFNQIGFGLRLVDVNGTKILRCPDCCRAIRGSVPKCRCGSCNACRFRQWRRENPDAWKDQQKSAMLKSHLRRLFKVYGITPDQYEAMLVAQQGKCAICRKMPSSKRWYLSVDHCHTTGKVRELLCNKCNTALGLFEDDADALRAAVAYVERHSTS